MRLRLLDLPQVCSGIAVRTYLAASLSRLRLIFVEAPFRAEFWMYDSVTPAMFLRQRRRYHSKDIENICSHITNAHGITAANFEIGRATRLNSSHMSISYAVFC